MELTPFTVYFIFIANNVVTAFVICAFISAILIFCAAFFAVVGNIEGDETTQRACMRFIKKYGVPIFVISSIGAALTPRTQTLIAMYGIPTALTAAEKAIDSELAKDAYQAVHKLLKDYIKETK